MFDSKVLARNIRKYRIKNNMTQAVLAEKIYVTEQAVSKWECGISVPDLSKICDIAKLFNFSVDELLFEREEYTGRKAFLGIDGGGTKTEFLLFLEDGTIINRALLEGSNPNSCSMEQTLKVLKNGIDLMLSKISRIYGIFAGISGCGDRENADEVCNFLEKRYGNIKISCGSDILNVIASATDSEKSVAAISGTGSNVFAKTKEELYRVGGWGYLLGDACSGYSIGREALRTALAYEDGFGEKTVLTDLVHKRMGGKASENLGGIYKKDKNYIGEFAPLVFEALEKDDCVACEILERESLEIARLINFASKQYDCQNTVVLSGSIFEKTNIIEDFLKKELNPELKIKIPQMPQIYGACKHCLKINNIKNSDFEKNFAENYKNIE